MLWDSLRYQQRMAREPVKWLERQGSGSDVENPKPIAFDLTRRIDGTYYLWLTSCGVGGVYVVRLKTL
ncbi:hypothetical protein DLM85_22610 [Hymenobacter edaphi]|uniref:Uncharacterized protein n=2 Tax=Hymenobacter edaphi TaxID=2211146 RepID=A0A328B6B7_9BACT|nr:hypothetical protein DLM85_22610 [Hymenobacter edaphi]